MKRNIIKLSIDGIPTEVRLFKAGANETSKGTFFYDASKRDELTAHQLQVDTRDEIPFDLAHLSLSDVGTVDAHKAYGWGKLDYAEDGIWLRDIKWTEQTLGLLQQREFRYFSPAFTVDNDNNITEILNVALTNIPASHDIEPLVADKKDRINMEDEIDVQVELDSPLEEMTPDGEMPEGDEPPMTDEEKTAAIAALQAQVTDLLMQNAALVDENAALKAQMESSQPTDEESIDSIAASLVTDGFLPPSQLSWAKSLTLVSLSAFDKAQRRSGNKITARPTQVLEQLSTSTIDPPKSDITSNPLYRAIRGMR